MGVVDYWRGECPHCNKRFDCDEDGHMWGEIQTKIFSYPYARDFFPGSELPEFLGNRIYIGDCYHCHGAIHAVVHIRRDLRKEKLIVEWREGNKNARWLPKELRDKGTRYILDHYE
jgi:hypothetical protein